MARRAHDDDSHSSDLCNSINTHAGTGRGPAGDDETTLVVVTPSQDKAGSHPLYFRQSLQPASGGDDGARAEATSSVDDGYHLSGGVRRGLERLRKPCHCLRCVLSRNARDGRRHRQALLDPFPFPDLQTPGGISAPLSERITPPGSNAIGTMHVRSEHGWLSC